MRSITRWLSAVALGLGLIVIGATAAAAQVAPDGNASPDAPVSAVLTVNNTLVLLITGLVIPLVNGLLLREENPAWIKLGLAAGVSAVGVAFINAIQDDGTAALSQEWFVQVAIVFATALGSYARVWQPLLRSRGGVNAAMGPGVIPVTSHNQ